MTQHGEWPSDSRLDDLEAARVRELELLDRIAGLKAQLSEVQRTVTVSPSTTLAAEVRLREVTTSARWYAGGVVELPYRALRRVRAAFQR